MKMTRRITRTLSWLAIFAESEYGFDAETGNLGVVVPGISKDGGINSKGNVITAFQPDDSDDVLAALNEARARGPHYTVSPGDSIRRSFQVNREDDDPNNWTVSFKTSEAGGTRTVYVPFRDFYAGTFVSDYADKVEEAKGLLKLAAEMSAEAAKKDESK